MRTSVSAHENFTGKDLAKSCHRISAKVEEQ